MSLVHWWPLNGDLQDYVGGNTLVLTNNTGYLVESDEGKLGGCWEKTKINTTDRLRATRKVPAMPEQSIAAWVYVTALANTNTANGLITHHDHDANTGFGITLKAISASDARLSCNTGNGSSRTYHSYYGTTNLLNAWHHVCATYDATTVKLYVDGVCEKTASYKMASKEDYFDLFAWSIPYSSQTYRPAAKMCDVRVYDHTLSQFEIQELSKGLKIHYTFDDPVAALFSSNLSNEGGIVQPTIAQNTTFANDAAIGNASLVCQGSTYIVTPSGGDCSSGVTASVWVNVSQHPGTNQVVFVDGNSGIGFGFYSTSAAIISCASTSAPYPSNIKASMVNGWNHFAVVKRANGTIECYVNGTKQTTSNSNNWTQNASDCVIGARNSGSYTLPLVGKVNDFRLYNTALSEEEILGLYKKRAFVTDKGDVCGKKVSENFSAGAISKTGVIQSAAVHEPLSNAYIELEYIQSTGTQYIDTGYISKTTDFGYKLDMAWTGSTLSAFESFAGFMASNTNPRAGLHKYSSKLMFGANETASSTVAPVKNERFVYYCDCKSGAQKLYKNNTQIATSTTSFNHSSNTMSTYLFARNASSKNLSNMRLYSAQILEGDNVVRDFIPVRRKSDNALGVLDKINNTFYANAGTGTFVAGPVLTTGGAAFSSNGTVTGRQIIEI